MSKTFRPWDVDRGWLLPPSVHELVPPGHVAHFARDTVREALGLSAIFAAYREERGYPPDHPGIGRRKRAEPKLAAEVAGWLAQAAAADAAEGAQHGPGRRGDELPDRAADKVRRLERIRAAKAALQAEAAAGPDDHLDPNGPGPSSGMRERGNAAKGGDGTPPERAQRNFTDPDSRIQPTQGGAIAGYNGQIAVDQLHQIIVAQRLATNPAGFAALVPLVDRIGQSLGRKPKEVSADSGFAREANLLAMDQRRIAAYLAPGRSRHGAERAAGTTRFQRRPRMAAMARTIERAGRRSRDRLRQQVVEPVFGQIKQARGFRQFLLRGRNKVRGEWALIGTAHNLLKLASATPG